jgi:hypothetical protein
MVFFKIIFPSGPTNAGKNAKKNEVDVLEFLTSTQHDGKRDIQSMACS